MIPSDLRHKLGSLAVTDSGFMFDPSSGSSYGLNRTGARLLDLLRQGRTETEIIAALAREFEVSPATVEYDLYDFVCQLKALKLVEADR